MIMQIEILFTISNLVVMPFWLLMIFAPRWLWTNKIMEQLWPIVIPALIYAGLLLTQLGGDISALLNPSLAGITALLAQPQAALIAWVHFLAFDLFAGRWVYLDSRQRRVSAWLASPALFLILMAGPLGFLIYLLLRWLWSVKHPVRPATQPGQELSSGAGGSK
jgi:hypothetical protein